jgi:hypothetical protein
MDINGHLQTKLEHLKKLKYEKFLMDFTQTLKKKISKMRKNGVVVFGYILKHMLNNN